MSARERQAGATGTIHDQGYQRYEGARLAQTRRFLVIARNVLAVAWKSRWGVKLPLLGALITLVVAAGILVVTGLLGKHVPRPFQADSIVFNSVDFFGMWGFILAATSATSAIADDLRSGAFQFYFSRPLRGQDYVRGKLLGLGLLIGMPMFIGPVVLAFLRVCMADDFGHAMRLLPLIGRAAILGVLATASLVLPAAGLGALLRTRRAAQAGYAIYFLILGGIFEGLAHVFQRPELMALSTSESLSTLGRWLFDAPAQSFAPPVWAAALGLASISIAGYAAIRWRVRSAETAGMGGG